MAGIVGMKWKWAWAPKKTKRRYKITCTAGTETCEYESEDLGEIIDIWDECKKVAEENESLEVHEMRDIDGVLTMLVIDPATMETMTTKIIEF